MSDQEWIDDKKEGESRGMMYSDDVRGRREKEDRVNLPRSFFVTAI